MKVLLILLLGLAVSCAYTSSSISLDGTTWAMTQYSDSSGTNMSVTYPHGKSGHGYWIAFRADTIYGADNCNHFSGTYKVVNSSLTTADLLSTLIGCPETVDMIAALDKAKRFELINSRLYLYTDHPKLPVLVFEKIG